MQIFLELSEAWVIRPVLVNQRALQRSVACFFVKMSQITGLLGLNAVIILKCFPHLSRDQQPWKSSFLATAPGRGSAGNYAQNWRGWTLYVDLYFTQQLVESDLFKFYKTDLFQQNNPTHTHIHTHINRRTTKYIQRKLLAVWRLYGANSQIEKPEQWLNLSSIFLKHTHTHTHHINTRRKTDTQAKDPMNTLRKNTHRIKEILPLSDIH